VDPEELEQIMLLCDLLDLNIPDARRLLEVHRSAEASINLELIA